MTEPTTDKVYTFECGKCGNEERGTMEELFMKPCSYCKERQDD